MSVVETREAPIDLDAPIIAHRVSKHDPTIALCGARLIGVPAPHDHPTCATCQRLHEEWLRIRADAEESAKPSRETET